MNFSIKSPTLKLSASHEVCNKLYFRASAYFRANHQIIKLGFLVFLLATLGSLRSYAQGGQNKQDRFETMHIAFLSQRLNLTPEEAQNFWPLYNQYNAEVEKLQQEHRDNVKMVKETGGIDNMTDDAVQKLITSETDIETRQLDLKKEYIVKFEKVIPIRKVAKLFIAEEQFKRYLLNQLSKRRQYGGGQPGDEE